MGYKQKGIDMLVQYQGKYPKFGGVYIGYEEGPQPPQVRTLNLLQRAGGSITSDIMTGYDGDIATVTNTPDIGYSFGSYAVTGSTFTGNQIQFDGSDIFVIPTFVHDVYNVNLSQTIGGIITANKTTGYYGDTITLSNTANTHYGFNGYSLTGATLTSNKFNLQTNDVTAQGSFTAWPIRNLTLIQQTGGTIGASTNTGYDNDVVTLSNTANSGYAFNNYSITGATLTGSNFKFNGGNVTAKANFVETLPPYTLRLKYKQGETPWITSGTATLVDATNNIWDYTYNNQNWREVLIVNDITDIISANVTDVKYFRETFASCTALSSVCSLQTSNCKSFYGMFEACKSLKSIPLFDMSNATGSQWNIFRGCSALTSVPAFVFGASADLRYMFSGCYSLKTVSLFDTSKVKSMSDMFSNCTSLTSVPLFNTSSVKNMNQMFWYCTSLKSVPLFNTVNVTGMNSMFNHCTSLTSLPLFNTNSVTSVGQMAGYCYNVQTGALALYRQMSTQTTPPTQHQQTFYNCGVSSRTGSAELAQIPSDWK